jgi:hypothetical protein
MVDGFEHHICMLVTCLVEIIIYPSMEVDGCIIFTTFFKPSKSRHQLMCFFFLIKYYNTNLNNCKIANFDTRNKIKLILA